MSWRSGRLRVRGSYAYDHWLRDLSHLRIVSAEEERAAREHFRAAIDLEPNFARAHAGLAMATFTAWSCGAFGSWHEDIERCVADAHSALSLDPSDHLPHGILACAYLFLRDFEKSKAHFDRAIALNPNRINVTEPLIAFQPEKIEK